MKNEYQIYLDNIKYMTKHFCSDGVYDVIKTNLEVLQGAINRFTPKKVERIPNDHNVIKFICPTCGQAHYTGFICNYCSDCGQKLDWSEDE